MNKDLIYLAIVLIWALVIRSALVPLESPWYDELVSLEPLDAPSLESFLTEISERDPPAQHQYFVLEYTWSRLFGIDYISLRWLSVTLGLISLVLVYLIGREIQGSTTGFVAAVSLASSQVHIEHSLEIRVYMLGLVWALVSVYSLLKIIKRPTAWWMALYILSIVGLVRVHVFGIFLLPSEALAWFVWGARSWRWQLAWFSGQLAAAGSLAFWYIQADHSAIQQAANWLPLPTLWFDDTQNYASMSASLVGTWYIWLVSSDHHAGLFDPANFMPLVIYGGLIATAIGLSIRNQVSRSKRPDSESTETPREYVLWLVVWWLVPALLLYALSHLWKPAYYPRYIFYTSVPLFLMVGWSVAQMKEWLWKPLGVLVVVVLSLFMGYTNTRNPQRPPWDSVLSQIEQSDRTGGEILLFSNSSAGNANARRTIKYLRPAYVSRLSAVTTSDEYAARLKTVSDQDSIHSVLLGSGPLEPMNEYLLSQNLTFTTTYFPARFPLTLYRIEGLSNMGHAEAAIDK